MMLRCPRPIAIVMALVVVGPTLGGCSADSLPVSIPGFNKAALEIDPADPCKSQREEFGKAKSYFTAEIATGTLTGGVMGTLAGGGVAVLTGGNVGQAMLVGGIGGAMAGGLSAYARTRVKDAQDQDDLARKVNSDLQREGGEITHTSATFARLRSCRFAEAWRLKQETRMHRLDRTVALQQLSYERERFAEELALAHEYGLTMAKRGDQFQEAASQIRQDQANDARQAALVKVAASKSIPEKRASFDKSVASAEAASKLAFNLDSNAKLTARILPARHA